MVFYRNSDVTINYDYYYGQMRYYCISAYKYGWKLLVEQARKVRVSASRGANIFDPYGWEKG